MFPVSKKYINLTCGLHKKEYQQTKDTQKGFYNNNHKFIKCNCREHISNEEYDEIIPQIIDEFINAGFYDTLQYFQKPIDIHKKYKNLQDKKVSIDEMTSSKTTDSNSLIRKYMTHIYDVKDYKGNNIIQKWTTENLKKAFQSLDKPYATVNSQFSEIIKRIDRKPVTIYSPIMTKTLLETLECYEIFDPCIGWGGRMLGTTCIKGHYTGCEPNKKTFQELKNMAKDLKIEDQITIYNEPIENMLSKLEDKFYDACLTSPPYYDLEIYSDEETQSIKQYKTYEEWLDKFIRPIIEYVCSHIIYYSCWSVKNFKTDKKYNLLDDIIKIHNDYGWKLMNEYPIKSPNGEGDVTYVFSCS